MSVACKVMLVDDDAAMLRAASRILTQAGFEVMTHEGAFDATNAIARFRPDVALIDVNMPFMSGEQLVPLIAKHHLATRTAIVLFSSNDETTLREMVVSSGAAGFIPKSAVGHGFAKRVAEFCRKPGLRGA